jgi:hypothetical protein
MNLFNIKFRKNLPNPFKSGLYGDLVKYEVVDYTTGDSIFPTINNSPMDRHLTLVFEENTQLGIHQYEMTFQIFNPKYPINDKFFESIKNSVDDFSPEIDCLSIKHLEDTYKLSSVIYN